MSMGEELQGRWAMSHMTRPDVWNHNGPFGLVAQLGDWLLPPLGLTRSKPARRPRLPPSSRLHVPVFVHSWQAVRLTSPYTLTAWDMATFLPDLFPCPQVFCLVDLTYRCRPHHPKLLLETPLVALQHWRDESQTPCFSAEAECTYHSVTGLHFPIRTLYSHHTEPPPGAPQLPHTVSCAVPSLHPITLRSAFFLSTCSWTS